jgi:hypothetical protein
MRTDISGLKNFAVNIRPLMKKMQLSFSPRILTPKEMNEIVQFYLETVDVLGKIESSQDVWEATH